MRTRLHSLLAIALCCSALPSLCAADAPVGYQALTRPSGDVTLSFVRPGKVALRPVEKGDTVKAGQLIAKQDDSEEKAQVAAAKAEADDQTEVGAETAVREADIADLEKKRTLGGSNAEIREAELKVVVDKARIELAKAKVTQNGYKYEVALAGLAKLDCKSPIDGVVAETFIKVGEVTDNQSMKVARIVQVDPMWVEVAVPILEARKLKPADAARITFLDKHVRDGKVTIISPIADSGSESITIRVEVPNPERLQPGEKVTVAFPGLAPLAAQ